MHLISPMQAMESSHAADVDWIPRLHPLGPEDDGSMPPLPSLEGVHLPLPQDVPDAACALRSLAFLQVLQVVADRQTAQQ